MSAADAPPPADCPPSPEAGGVSFGHFVVPRRPDGSPWELGSGAMGVTYKAFDTSLRTEVALKVIAAARVLEEGVRRRFQREARAAAKIRHPNVASVLYLGEQDGEFFYAMEFIQGRSLESLLKEAAGPLPPAVAVGLAAQAAAALNAAHRREVVHRDLKPANLMLLEEDALDHEDDRTDAAGRRQLKIIDFGLARSFGEGRESESQVTQSFDGFIGTPAYASPEQCAGENDLDGRSDLYSLGVILWQMLTGHLPFGGRMAEVIGKHQFQPPPFAQLAGLPAPLVDLLMGLFVKDPAERRPQNAGELRTALDRLLRALDAAQPGQPFLLDPAAPLLSAEADTTQVLPEESGFTTGAPLAAPGVSADYQIEREISRGNGGRLFLAAAADDAQGQQQQRVALKFLPPDRLDEKDFLFRVETALNAVGRHPHPVILTHAAGLQRSDETQFYVREWAEGFSLLELLRARGSLRAAEVFRLLDALPGALDLAVEAGFPLLGVALHKLFVVPPDGAAADDSGADWPGLCARPVEEWPAFSLKFNPLSFPPPAAGESDPALTFLEGSHHSDGGDTVLALARLARELMGGAPGSVAPLGALSGGANAVLRRALEPSGGGGRAAFPDCAAFWTALRPTPDAPAPVTIPPPAAAPLPPLSRQRTAAPLSPADHKRTTTTLQPAAAASAKPAPAPLPEPEEPPPAAPPRRFLRERADQRPPKRLPWKILLLAGLLAAGIGLWAQYRRLSDASTVQTDLAAAKSAASVIADPLLRVIAQGRIAVAQDKAGDAAGSRQTLADAKAAADAIKAPFSRQAAWGKIAEAQARTGDVPAARATAETIRDGIVKTLALTRIAAAQAQIGDISGAKAIANSLWPDSQKVAALCGIAAAQARAGVIAGFRQTISEAKAIADALPVGVVRARSLKDIAVAQADAAEGGNFTDARATASAIKDNFYLAQAQSRIALAQDRAGDAAGARQALAAAKAAADAIPDSPDKNSALASLAAAQAGTGAIPAAKTTAESIADDSYKTFAKVRIAVAQARAGYLSAAKATAETIKDNPRRAEALGRIAAAQARAEGGFAAAEAWIKNLPDPLVRSRCYLALAELRLNSGEQRPDDESSDEN